jgi:hypothetical protein
MHGGSLTGGAPEAVIAENAGSATPVVSTQAGSAIPIIATQAGSTTSIIATQVGSATSIISTQAGSATPIPTRTGSATPIPTQAGSPTLVIPAQAGIHLDLGLDEHPRYSKVKMDPGLRRDDEQKGGPAPTSTPITPITPTIPTIPTIPTSVPTSVTSRPAYAELHCLSNFSFLRGASSADELFERAAKLGYDALAITDECSLAGIVRALEASEKHGVPLIVGSEIVFEDGLKLVLLCESQDGYARLSELITRGRRAAAKGSYRLRREDIEAVGSEGLLALWVPTVAQPGAGQRDASLLRPDPPPAAPRRNKKSRSTTSGAADVGVSSAQTTDPASEPWVKDEGSGGKENVGGNLGGRGFPQA